MSVTFYAAGAPDEMDVNMSNSNAALVCGSLGIDLDPDWCGDMAADLFMGRVVMGLALTPADEGMPSYEHVTAPGQARFIEGARRPGYVQERLAQLHTLAQWAVEHQAEVSWA